MVVGLWIRSVENISVMIPIAIAVTIWLVNDGLHDRPDGFFASSEGHVHAVCGIFEDAAYQEYRCTPGEWITFAQAMRVVFLGSDPVELFLEGTDVDPVIVIPLVDLGIPLAVDLRSPDFAYDDHLGAEISELSDVFHETINVHDSLAIDDDRHSDQQSQIARSLDQGGGTLLLDHELAILLILMMSDRQGDHGEPCISKSLEHVVLGLAVQE